MDLAEPVTTLTDYVLAAASLGFANTVRRRIGSHNRVSAWYWCAAFLASAFAAALGGTFHGFAPRLDPATLRMLWNATIFSIGVCAALMTAAVRSAHINADDGSRRWLLRGIIVTAVGLVVLQRQFPRTAHFNYNDLYHLIQLVALYCLFRCARVARDRVSR